MRICGLLVKTPAGAAHGGVKRLLPLPIASRRYRAAFRAHLPFRRAERAISSVAMKPNYQYDKRQRDLAKKKLQDEKRLKKRAKNDADAAQEKPADSSAGENEESVPN